MGWHIGYHPSAFVWHSRRNELKTYWKQQNGYGKAEALLEDKWPDKYNAVGHIPWSGRLYGKGKTLPLFIKSSRIYQGMWGSALFQSIYEPASGLLLSLPLMPEWYLLIALLALLSVMGLFWAPLLYVVPLFVLAVIAPIVQAVVSASKAEFTIKNPTIVQKAVLYTVTAYLHVLQPLARLRGRVLEGLTPFKTGIPERIFIPQETVLSIWQEQWQSSEDILNGVLMALKRQNVRVHLGGAFDNWDMEVRGGLMGAARFLLTIEDHGQGKQMLRFRVTPNYKIRRTCVIGVFVLLSVMAGLDQSWYAAVLLASMAAWLVIRMLKKCSFAKEVILEVLEEVKGHCCPEESKIIKESLQ